MGSYKDTYRLKEERLNYNLLLLHRYMLILLILSPPKVVLIVSSLLILDLLLLQSHYTPHLITRLYLAFSCSAWGCTNVLHVINQQQTYVSIAAMFSSFHAG